MMSGDILNWPEQPRHDAIMQFIDKLTTFNLVGDRKSGPALHADVVTTQSDFAASALSHITST